MYSNQRIRNARIALHLSEQEVATRASLTIYELGDIETRADEFSSSIPTKSAFLLCSVLGLSIYELLGIDAGSSSVQPPQGLFVAEARKNARLTPHEVNEAIGYETGFIEKVEAGNIDLLSYPVELALDIAKCTGSSASQMLSVLEQASKSR